MRQESKFELVINLQTAEAIGLAIPNSMRSLAAWRAETDSYRRRLAVCVRGCGGSGWIACRWEISAWQCPTRLS